MTEPQNPVSAPQGCEPKKQGTALAEWLTGGGGSSGSAVLGFQECATTPGSKCCGDINMTRSSSNRSYKITKPSLFSHSKDRQPTV